MKIKNEKRRVVSEIIEDEEQITIIYDKEEDTEIDAEALAEFINEAIVEFYNEESEEQTEEDEVVEAEEEEVEDLEEDIDEDEDEFEIDEEEEEELDEEETEDEEEIDEIEEEEEEEEDEESYLEEEDEERNIWDKKDATEKRFFKVETRVSKKGKRNIIEGHAAVFNELSEDLGGFREKINPGAFDDVLDNDVRAFFNHDPNFLLARTSSGTLKLSTDKRGLKYSFDVPDTTAGRDLLVSMKRGDITQSSFAFQVESDSWNTTSKGEIRTIEKVSRLFDVSPVSIPAYPTANDLSIAQRSRMTYKDKTKMKQESEYENRNNLLELKINILKRK
jgi:HK97 family phage prohead protease